MCGDAWVTIGGRGVNGQFLSLLIIGLPASPRYGLQPARAAVYVDSRP